MDLDFYGDQTLDNTEFYNKDPKKAMYKPLVRIPKVGTVRRIFHSQMENPLYEWAFRCLTHIRPSSITL